MAKRAAGTARLRKTIVDAALKARWAEAISRYRKSRAIETSGWDERYEALGEIIESEPPYYLAGGYKTARAFLAAEAPGEDERGLRRAIRVARHFDPEDEASHGVAKLEALLQYLEATGQAKLPPVKLHLARQRVRVQRGKTRRLVPFADVSVAELRQSTRAARGGRTTRHAPPAVKAIRGRLAQTKLGAVSVQLRKERVDFGGVPLERLGSFAKALAKVKLPVG